MSSKGIKNICVYSSSCPDLDEIYYKDAQLLGSMMGAEGFNVVYGGGALGCMYKNAKAVKDNGGKVFGVLPEKLHRLNVGDGKCDRLIVTKCMRSRKEKMDELSDAVIALAGGFGTLEELSEMIVQKQLGYTDKAIVILNTNNFYDDLIKFFDKILNQKFASSEMKDIYYIANTPEEVISYLKNYIPQTFGVEEKLGLAKS